MPAKRTCLCLSVIPLIFVFSATALCVIFALRTWATKSNAFPTEYSADFSRLRMKRQQYNACNNSSQIMDISQFKFRDKYKIEQPWPRSSKFFMSKNLLYNWNWIRANKIRGLEIPLSSVIRMYDKNKCLFMPWDGAIRNLLLSAEPIPIIAELSCSLTRIYSLCKVRFGKGVCHRLPNTSFVLVGDPFDTKSIMGEPLNEPLRLYSWKTLSGRANHELDFTVNALGLYDDLAGNLFLIDSTGKGFADACGKKVRAVEEPLSRQGSWNQGNTFYKALRMYDLLSYDMISTDEQQEFVKSEVRRLFSAEKFERFYCENICEGFFVAAHSSQDTRPFCYHGRERYRDLARRIDKFKKALQKDFENSLYSVMEARIGRISQVHGKLPTSSTATQQPDDQITAAFVGVDAGKEPKPSVPDTITKNAFIIVRQAEPSSSNSPSTDPTTSNTPKSYPVLRTLAPVAVVETSKTMTCSVSTPSTISVSPSPSPSTSQTAAATTGISTSTTTNPKPPTTSVSPSPSPSTSQKPAATTGSSTRTTTNPKPPATRPALSDDDFIVIYYTFPTRKYYNVITHGPPVDFSWKK